MDATAAPPFWQGAWAIRQQPIMICRRSRAPMAASPVPFTHRCLLTRTRPSSGGAHRWRDAHAWSAFDQPVRRQSPSYRNRPCRRGRREWRVVADTDHFVTFAGQRIGRAGLQARLGAPAHFRTEGSSWPSAFPKLDDPRPAVWQDHRFPQTPAWHGAR
jgi:hypothetical protein